MTEFLAKAETEFHIDLTYSNEIRDTETAKIRFLKHIRKEPETNCWIWIGEVYNNYGKITYNKKTYLSTKFAYELFKNEKVEKHTRIKRSCKNPLCHNPDHLFI